MITYVISSATPTLRCFLIKNHLSEPEFRWCQAGINRADVSSELFPLQLSYYLEMSSRTSQQPKNEY